MQIAARRLPPVSSLYSDYLDNWRKVQPFYPQSYSLDSIAAFARTRRRPKSSDLDQLCRVLAKQQKAFSAGPSGVEKLAAGAVAVITGQQPGLFTGPHYSILKAVTAVKIARRLEQSGVAAVPVFWIAAEDHDFAEIESAWLLNREFGLCRARVDLSSDLPAPVGWLKYRDDIRGVVNETKSCFSEAPFAAEAATLLEACYWPGRSPVEGFGSMMAQLFAGTSLTFVDPLDPEFKAIARPVTAEMALRNSDIRAAVLQQNKALEAAGYHQQVKVDSSFTGLFAFRGRARQLLKPNEVHADLALSPNALMRPVLQDSLFPTAAYVGGPAEVAYFAQASAIYKVLDCPMPPIFPRISATIIEPQILRSMKKYGVEFLDVFEGRDFLKHKCVSSQHNLAPFDRVQASISEELKSLGTTLGAMDPTLLGALETSRRKILYQAESLRTRYVNAASRRDQTIERHIDGMQHTLFPDKKPQERVLNVASFVARHGMGWVQQLDEALSLDSEQHQLVEV